MAVLSAYKKIKQSICEQIKSGKYPPGGRIPTEREMCEIYGVSRITIRRALGELEDDGILIREQGRGTFVRHEKIEQPLTSLYSFTEELRKQNITPGTRVLSYTQMPSPNSLMRNLDVSTNELVSVIVRLYLANEVPYIYETSYIPAVYMGEATADEIQANGLYNTLEKYSGLRPQKAIETFEAIIAPNYVTETLGRSGALGVMQVERQAFHGSEIIEYCCSYVAGDKYRFRVTLE